MKTLSIRAQAKMLIAVSKSLVKRFSFGLFKTNPIILILIGINSFAQPALIHGDLSVSGNKIVNKNGIAVNFAGNSLFWCNTNWGGEKYYNASTVAWLRNDWNSAIVRAAMGVETDGGYLSNKTSNKAKVKAVVDAAIANDMYVIIDWHTHNAEANVSEAINFFKEMAQTYGNKPNVIYEVYNEPINSSWTNDIKPYAEQVIDAIRSIDPDNLIIVGTRFYSAYVNEAADNPINKKNIAYTIHFYAAQHKDDYRERCRYALSKGVALFATEWGAVNADGNGNVDESETYAWINFLNQNKISHCNWSINDKNEGASALTQGASSTGNWSSSNLTWSGSLVRTILKSYDYGKLTDEVNFKSAPIITSSKLSYTFTVNYTAIANRDLVVRISDSQGKDIGKVSYTVTSGSSEKQITIAVDTPTITGNEYKYTCELRPVGGDASSNLVKKEISNVQIIAYEPLMTIEAEAYGTMSGIQTEPCDEGGVNVGYLDTGDWLSYYNITIPKQGTYMVYYRVASPNSTGEINLEKDAGKTLLGTLSIPASGDWQTWKTVSQEVDLPAGTYNIGLAIKTGGYNLNMFAIAEKKQTTTAIDDQSETIGLQVYPSPAKDYIHIHGVSEESTKTIYNIYGTTFIQANSNYIEISSLPVGTYFINAGLHPIKFIKE
ncbi:MAG: cellulase family glycosylhydrolase [Cytophagales bacterium]